MRIAFLSLLFWCIAVDVSATDFPPAVEALIPQAEAEGELHVFGVTLNPRQVRNFERSFNAMYGTDIALTISGGLHPVKASEVALAYRSGVPTGIDVFWTGIVIALINTGALQEVDWTGVYGADPSLAMGRLGLRTHDSHRSMITVHTGRVKPPDHPRTYWDLLDPKWHGRIVMSRTPEPWIALTYALGEEDTARLLTGLVTQQNPKMLPRYPDIRARVVAGEFPIAIGTDIFMQKRRGAPVDHPDMDILALTSSGAFVMADTPHPAAAVLWGLWAVSPEGQAVLEQERGYSLAHTPGTALYEYAEGRQTFHVPFEWRLENYERLAEKYFAILEQAGS